MKLLDGASELNIEEISVADAWADGRELVILRGAQGVAEWEGGKEGGKEEEEGGKKHVLRYRVRMNPPCITELRFSSKYEGRGERGGGREGGREGGRGVSHLIDSLFFLPSLPPSLQTDDGGVSGECVGEHSVYGRY